MYKYCWLKIFLNLIYKVIDEIKYHINNKKINEPKYIFFGIGFFRLKLLILFIIKKMKNFLMLIMFVNPNRWINKLSFSFSNNKPNYSLANCFIKSISFFLIHMSTQHILNIINRCSSLSRTKKDCIMHELLIKTSLASCVIDNKDLRSKLNSFSW